MLWTLVAPAKDHLSHDRSSKSKEYLDVRLHKLLREQLSLDIREYREDEQQDRF